MILAHDEHVPFSYVLRILHLQNQSFEIRLLKHSWHYLDLLLTSGTFIPIIIPSCQRYERFVSLWWFAMNSFNSGHKRHLRSSSKCIYTKTPVKLLAHLFLRKMDWLLQTYLASFIQHVSIFIHCRRWHMCLKTGWGLFQTDGKEQSLEKGMPAGIIWFWITICTPKQKRANFSKQPWSIFRTKKCHQDLDVICFLSVLIELDGFSWHDSKSRILQWHFSSVSAGFLQ